MATMQQIRLASVPKGMPALTDFQLEDAAIPACPPEGVLVETLFLSVDPYLRGRISGVKSYTDPIPVGELMISGCVGRVLESKAEQYSPGDYVCGYWAWAEFAALAATGLLKLNEADAPITTALGILGMPGMTAYFGLLEICAPQAGETVFVSGAAGAVGSAVGQIAKIRGCRVVGSAGTKAKVAGLLDYGFDAAFDYHTDRDYRDILDEVCPDGIDCYFDNVGGPLTDAVFSRMKLRGRVSICGQISAYNDPAQDSGPRPFLHILARQLRVEGFIVSRWLDRFPEGRKEMAAWLREGKLKYTETFVDGLSQAPRALIGLFHGENTGKFLVRVRDYRPEPAGFWK